MATRRTRSSSSTGRRRTRHEEQEEMEEAEERTVQREDGEREAEEQEQPDANATEVQQEHEEEEEDGENSSDTWTLKAHMGLDRCEERIERIKESIAKKRAWIQHLRWLRAEMETRRGAAFCADDVQDSDAQIELEESSIVELERLEADTQQRVQRISHLSQQIEDRMQTLYAFDKRANGVLAERSMRGFATSLIERTQVLVRQLRDEVASLEAEMTHDVELALAEDSADDARSMTASSGGAAAAALGGDGASGDSSAIMATVAARRFPLGVSRTTDAILHGGR